MRADNGQLGSLTYEMEVLSLLACSGLMPFAASAAVDTITCEGCTAVQMNQAQMQYSRALSPPTVVDLYILNPSGNTAKKVRITKDWDGGDACRNSPPGDVNCQVFTNVQVLTVEPIVVDYLGYMRAASIFNLQTNPPLAGEGMPSTAFDDLTHPQKRLAIHQYLMWQYGTWTTVLNGLVGFGWQTFQTFTVKYSDGSTVSYRWDTVGQVYSPLATSYKDRLGNIIPIKQEQLTEGRGGTVTTFNFAGGDAFDVAQIVVALANIGITMPPAPPESNKKIICTSSPYGDGGTQVSCKWG